MSEDGLTQATVLRLARLARLRLSDGELPKLTADLAKILGHVRSLDEVDTESVEPTAHVALDRLPFRLDEPGACLDRAEVLAQAPRHGEEGFSVPTFVDE